MPATIVQTNSTPFKRIAIEPLLLRPREFAGWVGAPTAAQALQLSGDVEHAVNDGLHQLRAFLAGMHVVVHIGVSFQK